VDPPATLTAFCFSLHYGKGGLHYTAVGIDREKGFYPNCQTSKMTTSNIQTPLVFEGLDEETQTLITELEISDIDNLLNAERGKQRENEVTDLEFAAEVYRQDLESARSLLFDRHMAQSMAAAVRTDGRLVQQAAQEEEEACGDRTMAHRLGGTEEIAVTQPRAQHFDTDPLAKLAGLYMSESMGKDEEEEEEDEKGGAIGAESSQRAAARGQRTDDRQLDLACEACRDTKKFFDVMPAPCQHNYCRDCLRDLFRASLTDESLFPPRCCRRPIPVDSVGSFLSKELKQAFAKKEIEFQTPNRTYCSDAQCSAFIAPSDIAAEIGTCSECGTSTCTTCKSTAHTGDCPADSSLQGLLHLAGESGWQRCYSCRRMVELDHGCNHITSVIHVISILTTG
jgi:hypothetical protein